VTVAAPEEPPVAAPDALGSVLIDAALGPGRRFVPGVAAAKATAALAARPHRVARRAAGLGAELARIAAGRSDVAPKRGDRRFADPAWTANPAFRRLVQAYLAAGAAIDGLLSDAALDWSADRRLRFAVENVVDALAPSNFPLANPSVLKALVDTGGVNFARGARHFLRDMAEPPRIPSMVDRSAFEVGRDLAVTPGAVVVRSEVLELLQYAPSTERVRERPVLIVPPMINKYYVADLAPGRSMIEHVVASGQQTFAISWRNPDARHAGWTLDTYADAILDALAAIEQITGADATHVMGLCAGGVTLTATVAHLAAIGELDRIAGLTLGVCVIDNAEAGTAAAIVDRNLATLALADSHRRGYLDGRALAGVFAWLRPNDLIWSYVVNNYYLGKEPPAFDILFWNADTTNMPAGLHRDFLEIALTNALVHPGERTLLDTPVDLSAIDVDSYLVAGIADHITPWQSCYRTTQLLGAEPRFVLSTSGHIAAMVNPPGNPKASYRVAEENPPSGDAWLEGAVQQAGTWWEDWAAWLAERSGDERPAPETLGGAGLEPLAPAPGTYVRE
jgi:polyhydroxyalkanoate synthase subunit PhaC